MNPETKEISENIETDGVTVKLRLRYPYVPEETKAAKRVNAYLDGVFSAIKEKAAKSRRYSFFVCNYSSFVSCNGYFSVFFELTAKGKNKAYLYSPFSFTFDTCGRAVPLFLKIPGKTYRETKKAFASSGVKLTKKEFLYSYYLCSDGAVIYGTAKRASGRNGYIKCVYKPGLKEPESKNTVQ